MVNNSDISNALQQLGLTKDEVAIYLCLLKGQKNHLEVSRETNIARSNVYRLVDELIKKGLVHEVTTEEEEKLLESADPKTLELLVVQHELSATKKRGVFRKLLPALNQFAGNNQTFAIKNYSGLSGLKQMLWNELSTKGEICIFTCGNLSKATGKAFAEKFRQEIVDRGIMQRAIENSDSDIPTESEVAGFDKHNPTRYIRKDILNIMPEITIHDDTISIYNNWTTGVQLGTEIKNPFLATFMRQIFEHYWELAKPKKQ